MPKLAVREAIAHVGYAAVPVVVLYLVIASLNRVGPEEVANTWVWALRADDNQAYADLAVTVPDSGDLGPAWRAERDCLDWRSATVQVETLKEAPYAARAAVVDRNGRSLVRFLERHEDGWRIRVDTTCGG